MFVLHNKYRWILRFQLSPGICLAKSQLSLPRPRWKPCYSFLATRPFYPISLIHHRNKSSICLAVLSGWHISPIRSPVLHATECRSWLPRVLIMNALAISCIDVLPSNFNIIFKVYMTCKRTDYFFLFWIHSIINLRLKSNIKFAHRFSEAVFEF